MRFWKGVYLFLAIAISVFLLFLASLLQNPYLPLLETGKLTEQEYYLYSPSSQAKICSRITLSEYFHLTGEKSCFSFSSAQEAEDAVKAFLESLQANVVRVERIGDSTSIYAYTKRLNGGILLFQAKVNLHVVVKGEKIAVGTPIVFGGY